LSSTRNQLLQLLGQWKRKLKAKNKLEVVLKLIAFYEANHKKGEVTRDQNLAESTACPFRFYDQGSFFCGINAPRKIKLATLKICVVCLIKKSMKGMKTKPSVTASVKAYDNYLLIQAQKLVSGERRILCKLNNMSFKLLDVPCVKGIKKSWGMEPTEMMGCQYVDCEKRVKEYVRVYLASIQENAPIQ